MPEENKTGSDFDFFLICHYMTHYALNTTLHVGSHLKFGNPRLQIHLSPGNLDVVLSVAHWFRISMPHMGTDPNMPHRLMEKWMWTAHIPPHHLTFDIMKKDLMSYFVFQMLEKNIRRHYFLKL